MLSTRRAGAVDAPRVAALLIDTRRAFMPYAPLAHTEDEVQAWVAQQLVPGGGVMLLTRGDGRAGGRPEVLGLVATEPGTGDSAHPSWITQMAVDPAQVNCGHGSRLLGWALQALPRPIRLYTFQANHGARRFYERHGFRAIAFGAGRDNEERCPDVLYELAAPGSTAATAR